MVDDENAKKALERYFDIIERKRQPKARLCKTIKVEFSLDDSIETLWEKHDSAIESFRRIVVKDIKNFSSSGSSLLDLKVSLANRILVRC
jgi:uncharacterized Fe-S radical SAM superfamily protein PflX